MWRGWIIWAEWFITRGPACCSISVDFKLHSLGEGTYRLLRHSEGAKFFQFWAAPSVARGGLRFWTRASWWQQRSVLAVAQP